MSSDNLALYQVMEEPKVNKPKVGEKNIEAKPLDVAIKELQLKVKPKDEEDRRQIAQILSILQYPNTESSDLHQAANRLGNRDEFREGANIQIKKNRSKTAVTCVCCGFARQDKELGICTKLEDISNLGLPTHLYFQSIKNLAIILVEMILIYGMFALATNVIASKTFQNCQVKAYHDCAPNVDFLVLSLGSKQENPSEENQRYYIIQAWLGVAMVIVWFVTFSILKYNETLKSIKLDKQTKSAADYTIVIEGIPNSFSQKDFQDQLKVYEGKISKIKGIQKYRNKSFNIRKFNIAKPFYMNESELNDAELEKITAQQNQIKEKLIELILERQDQPAFKTHANERKSLYKRYEQNLQAQTKKIEQLINQAKEKIKATEGEHTTVAFVTFETNLSKNLMVELNPRDYSSRIRNFIMCKTADNTFELKRNGKALDIKVVEAPEPEDVIWENIGLSDWEKTKRKLITFSVTFLLLGVSLGVVFGLSKVQQDNSENRYLSILISLILIGFNKIIEFAIVYLSVYERDYTSIKYQISLAMKSILAQLLNTIVIPILANYFIKNNLYDKNGLADDIFMLGLTGSFLPPFLKVLNPSWIIKKILQCYKTRPKSKLRLTQAQLNEAMSNVDFQIGQEYIYPVTQFLFACFFISLHPIVAIFAVIGYFLMHWTQKHFLFNKAKRPIPGNDLVHTAMTHVIFLGPLIYSLGSLAWSNFFPLGTPRDAIIPNIVALLVSIVILVFPLNLIFSCCFQNQQEQEQKYNQNRLYMPTEYDRRNPDTSVEGNKDYADYMQEQMKGKSKEEQEEIAERMRTNVTIANRKPAMSAYSPVMMNFFAPQPFIMAPQFYPGVYQSGYMSGYQMNQTNYYGAMNESMASFRQHENTQQGAKIVQVQQKQPNQLKVQPVAQQPVQYFQNPNIYGMNMQPVMYGQPYNPYANMYRF